MAKRWMGGAVLVGCLLGVTPARAQYLPMGPGHGPMAEPMPAAPSTTPSSCQAYEGPISPQAAPKGPNSCCDLPPEIPNAFEECDGAGAGVGGGLGFWGIYGSAEICWWWTKAPRIPPLLTMGSTADAVPGAIGQGGTTVFFGGTDIPDGFLGRAPMNMGEHPAQRYTVGVWLMPAESLGVEANYFLLGAHSTGVRGGPLGGPGGPVIARPYFDINQVASAAQPIAVPNSTVGGIGNGVLGSFDADLTSRFWGAGADFVFNLSALPACRFDLLLGCRYLELGEGLTITTGSTVPGQTTMTATGMNGLPLVEPVPGIGGGPGGAFPDVVNINMTQLYTSPNTTYYQRDSFLTKNRCMGGEIGGRMEFRFLPRCFVNLTGKVACCYNHEVVDINGGTQTFIGPITNYQATTTVTSQFNPMPPSQAQLIQLATAQGLIPPPPPGFGQPQALYQPGAVLAQPSNIGHFTHDNISWVTELGVNVGFHVNCYTRIFVGYTLLHWNGVVRPADQIDLAVNTNQLPIRPANMPVITQPGGMPRPILMMRETDWWVQGCNLGLEFRF